MEEEKKEEKTETAKETVVKEAAPEKTKKSEKPKNCAQCNKPIKRKNWYYRNGKYFCGKGCWKLSHKKAA